MAEEGEDRTEGGGGGGRREEASLMRCSELAMTWVSRAALAALGLVVVVSG